MKTRHLGTVVMVGALAACGPREAALIGEGTLSGAFGGRAWTFVSGGTELFPPEPNKHLATLRDDDSQACDPTGIDDVLVVEIPFKPETYDVGPELTVAFLFGEERREATTGVIEVEEIAGGTIRAGLYALVEGEEGFEVSGRFEVDVCSVP